MNRGVDDEIIKICVLREGWIWRSMQKSRTLWHKKGPKEVIDSCEEVSLGYQMVRPSFIHETQDSGSTISMPVSNRRIRIVRSPKNTTPNCFRYPNSKASNCPNQEQCNDNMHHNLLLLTQSPKGIATPAIPQPCFLLFLPQLLCTWPYFIVLFMMMHMAFGQCLCLCYP